MTVGHSIVKYRKVLDEVLYILRTECKWRILPSEYGSGSTGYCKFKEWFELDIFKKIWYGLD
jgi:transposase